MRLAATVVATAIGVTCVFASLGTNVSLNSTALAETDSKSSSHLRTDLHSSGTSAPRLLWSQDMGKG